MHRHHILIVSLALAGLVALPGCANKDLKEGRQLIEQGRTDEGLAVLQSGVNKDPRDVELKVYYNQQRERQVNQLLQQADLEIAAGRFDDAAATLARVVRIHPQNPRARQLIDNLENSKKQHDALKQAESAKREGRLGDADQLVSEVLAQSPYNDTARTLQSELQATRLPDEVRMPSLDDRFNKPITLEFRNAPVRNAFDMISRQSGINFVFDKDVRLDTRATLFARDTPISEAIDLILATGQLQKKVVNDNTLLIYPDQPQKKKDYQPLAVKAFYLGNADARNTLNMLRTLIKTRDAYIDEKLNMLVIRDTPEAISIAERLIAQQDLPEPEVMLEVEVLEVQHNRLLDVGAQYPNQLTLLNTQDITTTSYDAGGNPHFNTITQISNIPLAASKLRHITGDQIGINTPAVNLKQELGDVNLLANPRIRVKNREKAKIHIGDKVPVITSNATSTGVVSESVSYLDVGLKLDVEPQVMNKDDVQIKVNLEVSNIVNQIKGQSGSLTYQIGTRTAGTVLRLHDGETQVLAGLISEADRKSQSGLPWLSQLPIIGHLFSTNVNQKDKSEIVLLITPRVLRTATPPHPTSTYFPVGTENRIGEGMSLKFSNIPAPQPLPAPVAKPALPAPVVVPVVVPPPRPEPQAAATPVPQTVAEPVPAPASAAPKSMPIPAAAAAAVATETEKQAAEGRRPMTAAEQAARFMPPPPPVGELPPADPALAGPAAAPAPAAQTATPAPAAPAPEPVPAAATEPAPMPSEPTPAPTPAPEPAPAPEPSGNAVDWQLVPIEPGSAAAREVYGESAAPAAAAPTPTAGEPAGATASEPAPSPAGSSEPIPSYDTLPDSQVAPYEQQQDWEVAPYEPTPQDQEIHEKVLTPQPPEGYEAPKDAVYSPVTDQPTANKYETGEAAAPAEPTTIGGLQQQPSE